MQLIKGYRPEAWGYVIYSPPALPEGAAPSATHEWNKSHNHELKADKWLISTLARIPQGMQNTLTKNTCIIHLSFVFLTLHTGTGGIHSFLGLLIMLVFQSHILN